MLYSAQVRHSAIPWAIPFTILWAISTLTACGAQNPNSAAMAETATTEVSAAAAGYAQVMASKTIDGEVLPSEARPTALVFFASWCGHCRKELGELGTLRKRFPTLRIIGLNAYEDFQNFSDEERLRAYVADNAPWLEEIVSADEGMRRAFGNIPKIPSLFLYGKSGTVVAEFRRTAGLPPSAEELEEAIVKAIDAP